MTDGPTTDGPTTDGPTTDGPTTDGPTTDGPTTDGPTTDGPTTDGSVATAPRSTWFVAHGSGAELVALCADVALLLAAGGRRVAVLDGGVAGMRVLERMPRLPVREVGPPAALRDVRWWHHELHALGRRLDVVEFPDVPPREGVSRRREVHDWLRSRTDLDDILVSAPDARGGGRPPAPGADQLVVGLGPGANGVDRLDGLRPAAGRAGVPIVVAWFGTGSVPALPAATEVVEVPWGPLDQGPLALVDPDGAATRAHRRVAAVVSRTGADPAALPASLLADYARSRAAGEATTAGSCWLAYGSADRPLVNRVAGWLRAARLVPRRVRPGRDVPPDGARVVAVLPGVLDEQRLVATLPDSTVAVALDPVSAPAPSRWRRTDASGLGPEEQRAVVLGGLDLFLAPSERGSERTAPTEVLGRVPVRDPRFAGRDDELDEIGDGFTPLDAGAPDDGGVVVVHGEQGSGKSRLAAEYVHRFADEYDRVLWVPAQDRHAVGAALSALARGDDERRPSSTQDAVHALRQGRDRRQLVVFDDVGPDSLRSLDLDGLGDVLITTTGGHRMPSGRTVELARLDRAGCAEILRHPDGVPGLTDPEVAVVVSAVGRLPLQVLLAGAFLARSVRRRRERQVEFTEARRQAVRELRRALDGGSTGTGSVVVKLLAAMRDSTGDDVPDRLALRLAELCSFLSPDGIDLDLLVRVRPMTEEIARDLGEAGRALLEDEIEIERALAGGVRLGLFVVQWGGRPSLRMHRVLQHAVRDLMGPAERAARRAGVLGVLARVSELAPAYTSNPSPHARSIMRELQRHFLPSGAADFTEDPDVVAVLGRPDEVHTMAWRVRRWGVAQTTFVRSHGGPELWRDVLAVATQVERQWSDRFGEDALCRRLSNARASLHFDLRDVETAHDIDDHVLSVVRRSSELLGHPRTALFTMSNATDLRSLGRYDSALPDEESVWVLLRAALGQTHPFTLAAATNLAYSRYLHGDQAQALLLQQTTHADRVRVLGGDHPWARSSFRYLGTYLGAVGAYDEARKVLRKASLLRPDDSRTQVDLEALLVDLAVAVVERHAGRPVGEYDVGRARDRVNNLRAFVDGDHPALAAASLDEAVVLGAVGRHEDALREATDCLHRLADRHPAGHPNVGIARADVAVVRAGADDHLGAVADGRRAVEDLAAFVSDAHPWRLAAQLNLARSLTRTGGAGEAEAIVRDVDQLCRDYVTASPGADPDQADHEHPVARVARLARATFADPARSATWPDVDIDLPSWT